MEGAPDRGLSSIYMARIQFDLEELDDEELKRVRADYLELARKAREGLKHGKADTGVPSV